MIRDRELKRLARFNAMLSGVISAIINVKDRDDFFSRICRLAVEEGGYKMVWIGIVEKDTQRVKPVSFAGFEEGYLDTVQISIDANVPEGRGPTGTALREGKHLISDDIEQADMMSPWRNEALKRGYRSSAAFPIIVEGKTEGSLNLYSSLPSFFDDNEVSLLKSLASDISFALKILKRDERLKQAHDSLKQSEEKFHQFFENGPEYCYMITPDGIITDINRSALEIMGYSREEMVGQSIKIIYAPEALSKAKRIFDKWKSGDLIRDEKLLIQTKSGEKRTVLLSAGAIRNSSGNIVSSVSVQRDITDWLKIENALRQSEARLNEAQRIAHIGNWELDLVNNSLHWSDEIYRMFEIDPHEFDASYEAFLDTIHPDDREAVNCAYTNSLKNKRPYTIDHRLLFPDGRIKYVHEECRTDYDKKGNPVRSLGTVEDITERVKTETTLRERTQEATHLGRIIENSLNEVYVFDSETLKFIAANNGARINLGYTMEEMKEFTPLYIKPEYNAKSFARLVEPLRSGEKNKIIFHTFHKRKDGSLYPVEVHLQMSKYGERNVFVAIILDTTIRKKYEEELIKAKESAETANRAKSDFLSRMSHDLRTPLNSIVGFAQVLSEEKKELSEREKLCIEEIEAAGWHLTALIDEILDIARIETARMQLNLEEFKICPLIEECISLMIPLAEKRNINISFHAGEYSHVYVRADKTRLREVFLNLLTNAVKYNVDSGFVSLNCMDVKRGKLLLHITNSGSIIPAKEKKRIFEPFTRLEGTDTALQGMGLGLSISSRLMDLMKGSIGLEKSSKKSNTFFLEIPVVKGEKKK